MLIKNLAAIVSIAFFFQSVNAQTPINLGLPINSALTSEYSPSLSGNGKMMIFQSTTGEDGKPELVMSTLKSGVWSRPEPVPNLNSKTGNMKLADDYNLSFDAKSIIFSSPKYGGVGGNDIWFMDKTATGWAQPVNPGKPLNSTGNEGDPSLSPDGKWLYFVRYTDKKTPGGKPCGKIFVAERAGKTLFKEPKELPAPINSGCECSPRIAADNQTLYFSSSRTGGKGGYDIYMSQLKDDGSWSAAVSLAYANTDKDDQYFSIPANADYIFLSGVSKNNTDLFKILLPKEYKPKKVILMEGIIKDEATQQPLAGKVVAYDVKKNSIYVLQQTDADGKYHIYLSEGKEYDLSVSSTNNAYLFYSDYISANTLDRYYEMTSQEVKLKKAAKGTSLVLPNITFGPEKLTVSNNSTFELFRLQTLLQNNPTLKVEIATHQPIVKMDSVSSPELTETIVDSVEVTDPEDSTGVSKIKIARVTYHNDITQKQADAIAEKLISKGIARERIITKGYGDSQLKSANPIASSPFAFSRRANEIKKTEITFK